MSVSTDSIIYGIVGATLLALFNSIIQSCWSLPFIITRFFGWTLFIITDYDVITTISKKIDFSSMRNDLNEPSGIIFGSGYVGFIVNDPKMIYCLCSYKQLEILREVKKSVNLTISKNIIELYVRFGPYHWLNYKKVKLAYSHKFRINTQQNNIIESIKEKYLESSTCVTLISGESGTGKSTVAYLLAKELNGSLCQTYCPTTPGDTLNAVYTRVEPTKENPLIILIDEVDVIFSKITNNLIIQHKNLPIEVYDKITWNRLLDHIEVGLYPNIILILTSNLTFSDICGQYDESFVRNGRVSSVHTLSKG